MYERIDKPIFNLETTDRVQFVMAAPVHCSCQGIDRSLVALARAVKISWYIILLLPHLTARAAAWAKVFLPGTFALAHPCVAPPLAVCLLIGFVRKSVIFNGGATMHTCCSSGRWPLPWPWLQQMLQQLTAAAVAADARRHPDGVAAKTHPEWL